MEWGCGTPEACLSVTWTLQDLLMVEGEAHLSGTADETLFPALPLAPLIILKIPDGALASLK